MMVDDALHFFSPPPRPANEAERQAAVDQFDFAGADDDPRLRDILARAAAIFGAPSAVISIVDRSRQRWVARHGVEGEGTPRATSFCGYTVLDPEHLFEVPDALADPRFAGNPMVKAQGEGIRFYIGAPLVHEGSALGALCVIDQKSVVIDETQKAELAALGRATMALLEERRRPLTPSRA